MDIKPANILVSKTLMAKITDFGEAINIYDKGNVKSGKTFPYAAPEMTQGK
jgi:serine/threonine protein kinase